MQESKLLRWFVQQNNESLIVKLSGELSRDTLFPLWEEYSSFLTLKDNQHIYWDLHELNHVDSAGFSLLVTLLNYYQQQHQNYLINIPEVVKVLAELFGLQSWFEQFLIYEKKHYGS